MSDYHEEKISPELEYHEPVRYGSFMMRLIARFLDFLILLGIYYFFAYALSYKIGLDPIALRFGHILVPNWIEQSLLILGYELSFHNFWGATPGKMLTGLRVIGTDRRPVSITRVLIRAGCLYIYPIGAVFVFPDVIGLTILSALFVVNCCWMMFSEESQMWHDVVARTLVLKTADIPEKKEILDEYAHKGNRIPILLIWAAIILVFILIRQFTTQADWSRRTGNAEGSKVFAEAQFPEDKLRARIELPAGWNTDQSPDISNNSDKCVLKTAGGGLHFDMIRLKGSPDAKKTAIEYSNIVSEDITQAAAQYELQNPKDTRNKMRDTKIVAWNTPTKKIACKVLATKFSGEMPYWVRVDVMSNPEATYILRSWGTDEAFRNHGPEIQAIINSFKMESSN